VVVAVVGVMLAEAVLEVLELAQDFQLQQEILTQLPLVAEVLVLLPTQPQVHLPQPVDRTRCFQASHQPVVVTVGMQLQLAALAEMVVLVVDRKMAEP
jgi:hypothetical protein